MEVKFVWVIEIDVPNNRNAINAVQFIRSELAKGNWKCFDLDDFDTTDNTSHWQKNERNISDEIMKRGSRWETGGQDLFTYKLIRAHLGLWLPRPKGHSDPWRSNPCWPNWLDFSRAAHLTAVPLSQVDQMLCFASKHSSSLPHTSIELAR